MGTFIEYLGEMDIPEESRAEYARQMLAVLHAGGMMSVEILPLYGRRIFLLSPPALNEEGRAAGCYNYFESDSWESWGLSARSGSFGSGKVGYRQFSRAVAAGYVLSALWSRSFGAVTIDGRLIREKRYIGWLNYVLGTQYSNERATRPDEMLRLLHEAEMEGGNDLTVLLRDVPAECMDHAALRVFFAADIWARPGKQNPVTEEQMAAFLRDRTIEPSLTLSDYISHALRRFRDSGGTLEEAEALLRMTSEQRMALYEADRTNLLPLTYEREYTVLAVAQTAVEFGADFWELWGRVKDCVPIGNEDGPAPAPCPPEEPVSTQEFFGLEAEQLAYYWTPESGIRFSDEMTAWMAALRAELESITEEIVPEEFLRTLVEAIAATETAFFRDAFYELIARQRERRVQSAVLLMRRLAEREGEEKLSRYSAILGNPALRQEAFGF